MATDEVMLNDDMYNKLKAMNTSKVCSVYGASDVPSKPEEPSKPTEPDKKPVESKLDLKTSVAQYCDNYRLDITINNTTNTAVNGWKLKIKKSDLTIQSMWNASYKEEGEYFVISPEGWNSKIEANGSVTIGVIAKGQGTGKFSYVLE